RAQHAPLVAGLRPEVAKAVAEVFDAHGVSPACYARRGPANKHPPRANAGAIARSNARHSPTEALPMLNELKTQRIALSIEVDRARGWRSSAALDKIRKGLEARLVALDKAIKEEAEKPAT
ncbi:MAG TPA: hypothetical protein PLK52_10590, partial [Usitatibacteraceae bacterium]|nr:hypothetical protein [Usitatibacteraceae bacterium]